MKKQATAAERRANIILQAVLSLLSFVILIPLYMIVVNSFKSTADAAKLRLSLPAEWHFENYQTVFSQGKILEGYFNSLVIGLSAILVIVISATLAAFILQRRKSGLTTFLYYLFIVGLVIPVALVPTIKTLVSFGLHNTYIGMILYYSAVLLPFTTFLLTGYIKTVPRELDESAFIDGANILTLIFKIIFPIIRPVIITAGLIIMINIWNDFIGPFYLLSDSSKWTVTVSVYKYIGKYSTKWNLVFADVTAVILPILAVYFFLQKYIVDGMTAGAIKA